MDERRVGCGTWVLVLLALAGVYGWATTRDDPGTVPLRGEVVFETASARAMLGPGCDPGGLALLVDPVTGSAKTVPLDRGEMTADGCRFPLMTDVPASERYRVTVPGTDLPARTVMRSLVDEPGAGGEIRLVVRLSW